ncbi:MAG: nitric oxide reductase activation protein NorD [Burkholderiales bacterium]
MNWSARFSEAPLGAHELEQRLGSWVGAVLSSRRSAAGIARSLAGQTRPLQDFVLRWTGVTAKSSPELAYQFAGLAARAVGELGYAGAEGWLLSAIDAYDRAGLHRASTELNDLAAFVDRARNRARGVSFGEAAAVLETFVAGLAGRRLKLAPAEHAWTDTATLYLPQQVAFFDSRAENFRVYKLSAALLWAQLRFGTYRRAPADYPAEPSGLALLNLLEALRLAARIEHTLLGLYRDFEALSRPALGAEFGPARERLRAPGASVGDSLAELRRLPASARAPDWPFLGVLDPVRALALRDARVARDKLALRAAIQRWREDLGESASQLRFDAASLEGGAAAPPEDVKRFAQSLRQDLGELPEDCLLAAGEGPYPARAHEADAAADVADSGEQAGALRYDEWDHRRGHYRKHWCVLRERDVQAGDPAFVEAALERFRPQIRQLKRSFEALRGEDKRLHGEPFGEDVDLDALVRGRAELAAGGELGERLFVRRARHERDMVTLFMVDMSGSTKGWINDCERHALVLLCEALEVLGDRYAIYGFSGLTRRRCEVYRVKRFDEPYDLAVRERIAGIQALDYTRMGAAIRHLSGILAREPARTRLLLILSDGKPDDFSDGYRGEYGIEDTRQALIEARRAGIHPFCITIDREAGDYLPHMVGSVNYTVVADVARLPTKLAELYRRLTA